MRQQAQGTVRIVRLGVCMFAVVLRLRQVHQHHPKHAQQEHGDGVPEATAAFEGDDLHGV